ncbi:hypothetical protein WA026_018500 [Henosepilachna vigintioctopunctata]|uniref:Hexosyltransferase n=1 Tax=Henosepilachna vigintioctopunctata TaxID=420089 RepID=A0AAW1V1D8_9CUCU
MSNVKFQKMRLLWYFLALIIFLLVCATYKTIIQINPQRDPTFNQHKNVVKVNDLYTYGFNQFNSEICSDKGRSVKIFIAVMSSPENEGKRLAIRKTWGYFAFRKDVSIVFFIGTTTQNGTTDSLIKEDWIHKDLIRCKSEDKLTLKTVHMLEWIKTFCPEAEFLMKTEDNVIINVSNLLQLLSNLNSKRELSTEEKLRTWFQLEVDFISTMYLQKNICPIYIPIS